MIIKSNVRCVVLDDELRYFFKGKGVYSVSANMDSEEGGVLIKDPYGEKWSAYELENGRVKIYGFDAVFEFI